MAVKVSIVKCSTYDETEVLKTLRQSIDLIGGINSFVKKGDRVLFKPNLLSAKSPEKAVTTHPAVVKGVVQIVQEAGGIPFLGDSPGIESAKRVAGKSGIKEVADSLGCPIVEFNRPVLPPERKGKVFKNIEIDQSVLEADVTINLPKWKTHAQMFLTLGVKNLFGCIPGPSKALWHLKAGEDPKLFAQMLVDLYQMIQPSLNILDGIVGMEGNGPGSGHPISLGLILASKDALGVDQIVCDLLGLPRDSLMTNRVAFERGLGENDVVTVGERLEDVKITNFKFPTPYRIDWYLPGFIKKAVKSAMSAKPIIEKEICKLCNQCVKICPTKALIEKNKGLVFDYGKCIRCFCCQEICPEGAITIQQGWGLKLVSRKP
jgi:uncharacterized protein (DUF362 family)/Pyruvate/2-oxoacid:ferredoxin oxidoreductase delta subunit